MFTVSMLTVITRGKVLEVCSCTANILSSDLKAYGNVSLNRAKLRKLGRVLISVMG